MKKSYKILQTPIPAPMLHVHITLQTREFSIQNPFYMQKAKSSSSTTTTLQIPEILRIEGKEIF